MVHTKMPTLYKVQQCTWSYGLAHVTQDVGYALSLEDAKAVMLSIISDDVIFPKLLYLKHNEPFLETEVPDKQAAVMAKIHGWLSDTPFKITKVDMPGPNDEIDDEDFILDPYSLQYASLTTAAQAVFMEVVGLMRS